MSPEVALFCRANRAEQCPVLGEKQPCRRNLETAEFDPTETWAAQDFRSAKALFVPSLKRDIVPSLACTRPPAGGVAWQSTSNGENSYSHWAVRQRGRSRRVRSNSARWRWQPCVAGCRKRG